MSASSKDGFQLPVESPWKIGGWLSLAATGLIWVTVGYSVFLVVTAPPNWYQVFLVLLCVCFLYVLEAHLTYFLRFGPGSRPYLLVTEGGLEGDVYPLSWYKPKGPTFVIRSPVFRRVIQVVRRPNSVMWKGLAFRLRWTPAGVWVGFLAVPVALWQIFSPPPLVEGSILAGLHCRVPDDALLRFVTTAISGGSDVHVSIDMLTEAGRSAALPCVTHDAGLSRRGAGYVRLGPPRTPVELASWFRRLPARRVLC